ncbi:tudor domain-containing protein 6-like [Trematomus bernacchii]|uniref:tudor domain-containing protein 6-like n=1 Tax=Trematomus bernacchii TaxID=40690 RepID=UPI00146C353B|nr:tudor domain-containing protein 6-like [Trematomus bernacchii]
MDDERKHIYEQMREEIQNPDRKFAGSEGKHGDLCLVCIDGAWHRARIVSIQSDTCNVFVIDQGLPHITTSKALAWGHKDSFLLPPETESCILANVLFLDNSLPERATKFVMSLRGKKFRGLVQAVLKPNRTLLLDIPMVSKPMCMFGVAKKMVVDEFKCLVQKCLEVDRVTQERNLNVGSKLEKIDQYFYPDLLMNAFEHVIVTEVTNPRNIFCQLHIFSKAVKTISEQMQQHYEKHSDSGETSHLNCGDPCAAKGMDGKWHRSLLKQTLSNDDAVEVFHVDEGKVESVPVGDIRPLHGELLRMPVVTYHCSLEGVTDDGAETTGYLKSLLLNKTQVAKFNRHNKPQDVYHITVYANCGTCINNSFIQKMGHFASSDVVNTEQDLNVQNTVNVDVDVLLEETLPNTKNQSVNGLTDGPSTGSKNREQHPPNQIQINGNLPTEVQNTPHDDVFAVGRSVNVMVSCFESLQKFWCQTTEDGDSLGRLMNDLQNHYASAHPQPLVESICVARSPDNGMWYRAKIMVSQHSPVVDVRFIDFGQTRMVPLRDIRPIDPAFLQLNAKAFQCCLYQPPDKKSTNPTWTDREFVKVAESCASSGIGLTCTVKAATCDEEGLLLNMLDIETPSDGTCRRPTKEYAQNEAHKMQKPPPVQSDSYNYSTHNIQVNGKEKVWIMSSDNVNLFYCQLNRNYHLFDKVMKNVKQLLGNQQGKDRPLGLNSICFAKYTDKQWYRGEVVELSPKLKVHFVDYGETLVVNEWDICPCPTGESIVRALPVQAVPLGLFNVPAEVPQEVNQWFADHAVGQSLTISVVAKGEKGKLIVELFDGSLSVNAIVREKISKMKPGMTALVQKTDQQLLNTIKRANSNETCARDELSSQPVTKVSLPEIEHEQTLDEGRKPTSEICSNDSEVTQLSLLSCPRVNISMYTWPNISESKTVEVYASCIDGPHFFWCEYADEEEQKKVTSLAQEAGLAQQDMTFPETLGPGCPCLALFSSDEQWYRAQVLRRVEDTFDVLFIDYGNETDVDIKNVRSVPQSLMEIDPQAFLCSLDGFDKSKGSWDDQVHDVFYNLLVDKLIRVKVLNIEENSDSVFPQYAVAIECENVVMNTVMQKYWKPLPTEHAKPEIDQTETSLQDIQTKSNRDIQTKSNKDNQTESNQDIQTEDIQTESNKDIQTKSNKDNQTESNRDIQTEDIQTDSNKDNQMQSNKDIQTESSKDIQTESSKDIQTESSKDIQTESSKDIQTDSNKDIQTESSKDIQTDSSITHLNVSTGNVNAGMFKEPSISKNKQEEVYASCIVGPHYFWCEYADEEEQKKVTSLAQEAGLAQQDMTFPETLGPGSPCLALFSSDEQWYRAQVLRRVEDTFDVLFIDYGNETDVDIKNVRSVPQSLMEIDPQAFLCSLDGFDKSKGSWDDQVHDVFYNLLVDKLIRVKVLNIEEHSDSVFPQYAVAIECENVVMNTVMQKYWKPLPTEHAKPEIDQTETSLQDIQTKSNRDIQTKSNRDNQTKSNRDIQTESNRDNQMQSNKDIQMESNKDIQMEDIQTESNRDNQMQSNKDIQMESNKDNQTEDIQTESNKDNQMQSNQDNQMESNKDNQMESNKDIQMESNRDNQMQSNKDIQTESNRDNQMQSNKDIQMESNKDNQTESNQDNQMESNKDIQTESNNQTESNRDIQTESNKDIQTESNKDNQTEDNQTEDIQTDSNKDNQTESNRDIHTESNKDNQTDSNKDIQTESNRDNQTESNRDIQTESNRDIHTESNKDNQTEDIQTESNRDNQTESNKDIQTESNRDNQTESNKDIQTESNKDIQTESNKDIQTDSNKDNQTESNITHLNVSTGNVNAGMFKEPSISKNKQEEVYASCIVGPHYFWCEYADEEEQKKVTSLAQEAGLAQQDMTFPETLGPGSPCLALFSSDEQWYRAQVLRRVEDKFDVLFIDYGNETDVDIKNVRSVPQSLMEIDPQAFLCSLDGFDKCKGSWDDQVHDVFYNLLVDKRLKVTVLNMDSHPDIAVPLYAVEVECEGAVVNTMMEKYWKGLDTGDASGMCLEAEVGHDEAR